GIRDRAVADDEVHHRQGDRRPSDAAQKGSPRNLPHGPPPNNVSPAKAVTTASYVSPLTPRLLAIADARFCSSSVGARSRAYLSSVVTKQSATVSLDASSAPSSSALLNGFCSPAS